jgi:hypothetical protein
MDELTGKRTTVVRPLHGGDEVRIHDDMSSKGPARPMDWSDTVRHEDGSVTFEGEKKRSENWPQKAS